MSNQTTPWWADRSRRVRLEVGLITLAVLVGGSFLVGVNVGGGGSTAGPPTADASASASAIGQAASPSHESMAPPTATATSPGSTPAPSATPPKATPVAKPTPKPTPRPTARPTSKPTSTPLPAPSGLSGEQIGKHVDLTWQADAGAVAYNVYRGADGGAITLLAKGLTKSGYRDLAVTAGTSYSYQVSAISSTGSESTRSRLFTIKIT